MKHNVNNMLLKYLIRISATASVGYLFSKYTKTFVGEQNNYLSISSTPLPFTIRMKNNNAFLYGSKGGSAFKVTHVGNKISDKFRIEMNKKGEIRIMNDAGCESVYRGFLKTEKCHNNDRQKFIWVPQSLFLSQGDMPHHRRNKKQHKKHMKAIKDSIKDPMKEDPLKDNTNNTNNIEALKHQIAELENKITNLEHPNKQNIPESTPNFKDTRFTEYINRSESTTNKCKTDCEPVHNNNTELLKELAKTDTSIVDTKMVDDMSKILNKTNLSDVKLREDNHKRKRGVYASGEDSTAENCLCAKECVRNPRNGKCYFSVDKSGKLEPILKTASCCEKRENGLCDLKNKLDKYLCDLTFKNDYSYFSKFIDDGYSCN